MVALQLAICVSSRVNDARTAQQLGVFVILPDPAPCSSVSSSASSQLTTPVIVAITIVLVARQRRADVVRDQAVRS